MSTCLLEWNLILCCLWSAGCRLCLEYQYRSGWVWCAQSTVVSDICGAPRDCGELTDAFVASSSRCAHDLFTTNIDTAAVEHSWELGCVLGWMPIHRRPSRIVSTPDGPAVWSSPLGSDLFLSANTWRGRGRAVYIVTTGTFLIVVVKQSQSASQLDLLSYVVCL